MIPPLISRILNDSSDSIMSIDANLIFKSEHTFFAILVNFFRRTLSLTIEAIAPCPIYDLLINHLIGNIDIF